MFIIYAGSKQKRQEMIIRRAITQQNPPQNEAAVGAFTGVFFILWAILIILII